VDWGLSIVDSLLIADWRLLIAEGQLIIDQQSAITNDSKISNHQINN
jgi:hypothetical protein